MMGAQSDVEKAFIRRLGRFRGDGREANMGRDVELKVHRNRATGQAQCEARLGDTCALAVVSASPVAPFADRPNEGILRVNVVLSAMGREDWDASQRRNTGLEAAQVSTLLENALLESRTIDLEGLCIVAGRKVWCIQVDVSIINDAGNIADCGCLAAFGALCHYRRPDVSVVGNTVKIFDLEDREPVPLSVHHTPLAISFALFRSEDIDGDSEVTKDQEKFFLLDPTDREELAQDGKLTVIVNAHREICGVHKFGSPALEPAQLARLVSLAAERSAFLCKVISESTVSS
ncbi:Exosome complex component RRP45 [Hondaea fermentalgiana]|uniref:Exosome complex component RRP45 n=1 Tax=Hondaea fermentalgiana TaxID=2315210 RepID=A0A2R5GBX9_9STRA|nr:Exosome complex component RRP45 [Hondaea fermentalgiana]|eukprot:GBG28502.1 Exosome complex component RRP45 [Hondaea fermentalgiana]